MNILSTTLSFSAIAIFVSLSCNSVAQTTNLPLRGPLTFEQYDINKDGVINEQEFTSIRAQRMSAKASAGRKMKGRNNAMSFTAFDLNNDGVLKREEFLTGQKAQREQRMQRRANNQKKRMKGNMPSYADFDLNNDGKINEDEFIQARALRISNRAAQGFRMKNAANMPSFADIDQDNDTNISIAEFEQHQLSHMKMMKGKGSNR